MSSGKLLRLLASEKLTKLQFKPFIDLNTICHIKKPENLMSTVLTLCGKCVTVITTCKGGPQTHH